MFGPSAWELGSRLEDGKQADHVFAMEETTS